MLEFLSNHYTWVFSGIGVPVVVLFVTKFFGLWGKKDESILAQPVSVTQSNNQQTTVNINTANSTGSNGNGKQSKKFTDEEIKRITKVLFIDDDPTFKVVKIFKSSGWPITKIVKDIKNLHGNDVLEHEIFFVDIHGVGKALDFKEEGLGLAMAIKKSYPDKKVVIYSADRTGDRFHEALKLADRTLSKDAEPYEFMRIALDLAEELHGNI